MSHLERTTRIHAPLEEVYAFAHDPRHWSDWYVGISDERDLDEGKAEGLHRHLMVGTPFPLTQRVMDDRLAEGRGHWMSRVEGPTECAEVTRFCKLLMLAGEFDWSYKASNGDTDVKVVFDFTLPPEILEQCDPAVIEQMEADCLALSLENLRRLCESARHPGGST